MRVVIGANSLTGPLTGIGHYTLHLAQSLSRSGEIEELRLLSHGWLSPPAGDGLPRAQRRDHGNGGADSPSLPGTLRVWAAKNRAMVSAYDALTAVVAAWSLRNYAPGDIFHSPDFQFAKFPGKKVVTIPDLSTLAYPEFHPPARVAYINRHIRRAVARADHIVTISDFVKREIHDRLGVALERITTIYPGVEGGFAPLPEAEFRRTNAVPAAQYGNYFLFVSTIEPRKNLGRLLEAYQRYLQSEGSGALPLIVAGLPGWHSDAIHRELARLQRTGKVHYAGYLERGALRTLIAGARALLFPSLYEGFGLPVVEAMRSGTAVLTSRDSAMSEIAGEAALLVSPHDTREMADNILRLHRDTALREALVAAGLRVGAGFCWEKCARETVALYRALASAR
jgi:glycosyltransferase involved in cell wall biosynthesis